jgi:hypothetical protein
MQFIQETDHERSIRRILSCTHTLYSVLDELDDLDDITERGDLLIAIENLMDATCIVTDVGRAIAWQSPEPQYSESEDD